MSPDRRQPGSGWLNTAYVFAVTVGVVGMTLQPSVSVRDALESAGFGWAILLWSFGFLGVGIACIVARHQRWYCAEVWAVYTLGGLFWLWAAMVAAAGNGTSWQAGLGFCCAGAFIVGWARYRRFRLRRNTSSAAALRAAVDRTVGEAIRQEGVRRADPDQ